MDEQRRNGAKEWGGGGSWYGWVGCLMDKERRTWPEELGSSLIGLTKYIIWKRRARMPIACFSQWSSCWLEVLVVFIWELSMLITFMGHRSRLKFSLIFSISSLDSIAINFSVCHWSCKQRGGMGRCVLFLMEDASVVSIQTYHLKIHRLGGKCISETHHLQWQVWPKESVVF